MSSPRLHQRPGPACRPGPPRPYWSDGNTRRGHGSPQPLTEIAVRDIIAAGVWRATLDYVESWATSRRHDASRFETLQLVALAYLSIPPEDKVAVRFVKVLRARRTEQFEFLTPKSRWLRMSPVPSAYNPARVRCTVDVGDVRVDLDANPPDARSSLSPTLK